MTMDKTAIIYARVSTVRQADDGLPIESQIEQGKAKAAALGAQVLRICKDEGISGRTSKRPAFQDAILLCAQRKVDYFIVWSTSRFARNKIDAASFKKILKGHGTRVVYVSVEIDSSTDEGWFSESIFEIVDEHYSRQISKDTKRSMMKNASDGFFNGGRVPLGYAAVEVGRRKKLEVAPLEAKIVRDIFIWCLSGSGCKEIAMRLNGQGVYRRGTPWSKASVGLVLKNPCYTGHVVFNRVSAVERLTRPEETWVNVKAHAAIVSDEDFAQVQSLMKSRAPVDGRGSPRSGFVFTGLLRCGCCGASMQIETATGRSQTYSYYNCRAALKGQGCANRRLPAADFDAWMVESILAQIFTPEQIAQVIRDVRELTSEWEKDRIEKIDALAAEIQGVDRRLNKLFEILETHGADTPNLGDLTGRLRSLKDRKKSLESEIADIETQQAPQVSITDAEVADAVEFLRAVVRDADPKKVRLFFSTFVDNLTVNDDAVSVEYCKDKLIETAAGRRVASATVHSRSGRWLPVLSLLRTATLLIDLPARFARAA